MKTTTIYLKVIQAKFFKLFRNHLQPEWCFARFIPNKVLRKTDTLLSKLTKYVLESCKEKISLMPQQIRGKIHFCKKKIKPVVLKIILKIHGIKQDLKS